MTLVFEAPAWLWLAAAIVPVLVLGNRRLHHLDRTRRAVVLGVRALLMLLLAAAIADPVLERRHDAVTVVGVVDASGSMRTRARFPGSESTSRADAVDAALSWFGEASAARGDDDRVGLVVFDEAPLVLAAPARSELPSTVAPEPRGGSDLESALRLAHALLPADAGRRIVLVSDGAETRGDALSAIAGVPVDVVAVPWSDRTRVRVARLDAPTRGRPGARVPVRIEIEATGPVSGELTLRREGAPIDLDPSAPGDGRRLDLGIGTRVEVVEVELLDRPINRIEALFAPDVGMAATSVEDRALAVVVTAGRGRVLVVTDDEMRSAASLGAALERSGIELEIVPPSGLPGDLLSLQAYDLVVLDDVPAASVPSERQELLAAHVESFGAGLIAIGGPHAFGAGGWNGSRIEDVLPLELDPPRQLRAPEAALVLVIDRSGSMRRRVAGARASQMELAARAAGEAVATLRRDSLVGVVTFAEGASRTVPLAPNDDPGRVRARIEALSPDGGTNLAAGLLKAGEMLAASNAERKHIVCLTDGQAMKADFDRIATRLHDEGVTITTIAIGDEADQALLRRIAELGEGRFHPVLNPRSLPRVLVDSVRVVDVPLVKTGSFAPRLLATGSRLGAELSSAPPLDGMVVTAPRDDPRAVVEATHPDGEPLLAHRRSGLGLAIAFTGDAGGPWSSAWADWSGADAFWLGLVRAALRPPGDPDAELVLQDERGAVEIELVQAPDATRFDEANALVLGPNGDRREIPLREEVPGRWIGAADLPDRGVHIVSVRAQRGGRAVPPTIGAIVQEHDAEAAAASPRPSLMAAIAERSGGREIEVRRDAGAQLFDRSGFAPVSVLRPAWWPVALATLLLLLVDVAARRVAWRTPRFGDLTRDALRRATPGAIAARRGRTPGSADDSTPRGRSPDVVLGSEGRASPRARRAGEAPRAVDSEPREGLPTLPSSETIDRVLERLRSAPQGRRSPRESENEPPTEPEERTDAASGLSELRRARDRARRSGEDSEHDDGASG